MLRKTKLARLAATGLALLLIVSAQAIAGPTYVFRQMISAGGADTSGYWLVQARAEAVEQTITLSASLQSLGYSSVCPEGAIPLSSAGSASVGLESPDTATLGTTYNWLAGTSQTISPVFCLPASPSDIRSFSVTGSNNSATFQTPIPYMYDSQPPKVDYASHTVSAGGVTYTVWVGSSYVLEHDGSSCGSSSYPYLDTTAVYAGVQTGLTPPSIKVPYVLGVNSSQVVCSLSSLSIYPNN